ncbi:uncharacterized protein At4g29660 isoform X2 [Cryptomeria japonica]|uniref:uncharacterized protein At4g29660 isoform X2 n=1 Tax=Cryptomeria japonica TaxID=3369 RepID=UPI0025ACAE38|nr:uncharacterized protein At4g29660 isoform X2 [Cryptomeria japonica]XP_057866971.1 uncharacterized protein At4g29660 isoform X2 [Cryptomeria japonica]
MAEHMPEVERMPERIKRWLRTEWLWRAYANRLHTQWQKNFQWILVEPYRRPRSFIPFISINIAAFYTGVVGAAIKEQLYKEKYWEEHPGEAVPMMKPSFYGGPWRVQREDFKEP